MDLNKLGMFQVAVTGNGLVAIQSPKIDVVHWVYRIFHLG